MPKLNRRTSLGLVAGVSAVAAIGGVRADEPSPVDRAKKLIETLESYRKEMPPAEGINEQNGPSVPESEPYILTHLGGVARRLNVKTRTECLVLATYLKDPDGPIRYIAIEAIESVVQAYPSGMSIENFSDTRSAGHKQMVLRFAELIDKLP